MNRKELVAAMNKTAEEDKPTPIDVDGWGTVYIRTLTVAEVEEQSDDTQDQKNKYRLARAATRLICNEKGERLFDPKNEEDVKLIASQKWSRIHKILRSADSVVEAAEGK